MPSYCQNFFCWASVFPIDAVTDLQGCRDADERTPLHRAIIDAEGLTQFAKAIVLAFPFIESAIFSQVKHDALNQFDFSAIQLVTNLLVVNDPSEVDTYPRLSGAVAFFDDAFLWFHVFDIAVWVGSNGYKYTFG